MTEAEYLEFERTLQAAPGSLEAFAQRVENDILDVKEVVEDGEFSPRRFLSTNFQDVEAGAVKAMEDEFQLYLAGQLAVHGRSNGGLLVGAVMTQRPDLFEVVCIAVRDPAPHASGTRLLASLAATDAPLTRSLDAGVARGLDLPAVRYDEADFRLALNEDAMATEKLAEAPGISAAMPMGVMLGRAPTAARTSFAWLVFSVMTIWSGIRVPRELNHAGKRT
mgnify:CR=1 FL=1